MNHGGWARAAQLNTRMFGWVAQAFSSAAFHFCMFASAYGPEWSREMTFTHMTGSPLVTAIISLILAARLTLDPTAMSAVSLVPSASTQQPSKPPLIRFRAATYAFVVPGITSTTERAPVMSV